MEQRVAFKRLPQQAYGLEFSGVHFAVAASSLGNQVTAGYTLVFAASLVCSM